MDALLDLTLEDAGAGGLVVVCYFEDVRCVDPVVGAAPHDMVAGHIEFVHGNLSMPSAQFTRGMYGHHRVPLLAAFAARDDSQALAACDTARLRKLTLLYVAL